MKYIDEVYLPCFPNSQDEGVISKAIRIKKKINYQNLGGNASTY